MTDLEDGHRAGKYYLIFMAELPRTFSPFSSVVRPIFSSGIQLLFHRSLSLVESYPLVDRTCAFLFDRVRLNEGTDGMFGYRVNKRTRNATPRQTEQEKRRMNQRIARTTRMERVSPVAIVPVNPFIATKHRVPSACSNFYVYLDTFAT